MTELKAVEVRAMLASAVGQGILLTNKAKTRTGEMKYWYFQNTEVKKDGK